MKKRDKILIIVGAVLFLFLLIGITIAAMSASGEKAEKRVTPTYKDEETITCIKENSHDEAEETESLYLQKGVLITKRNTVTWSKREPKEKTCEYYTTQSRGLSAKEGITSSIECNETRGTFTATYTIAELDREDIRLKEFDYLNSKGIIDTRSWIFYMKNEGYTCNSH